MTHTIDSAPRPRRTKLSDFPCIYYGSSPEQYIAAPCDPKGYGAAEFCAACMMLPIYEQAIADHRCARLLGIIDRWWGTIGLWRRRGEVAKWRRLHRYMRAALNVAGL